MAKAKEMVVIDKLKELRDYATQTENYYLLGRVKRIIEEVKIDEIAKENYHKLDVDPKGIQKEVTWESILEEFNESGILRSNTAFIDWLNSNYSVPTKKQ